MNERKLRPLAVSPAPGIRFFLNATTYTWTYNGVKHVALHRGNGVLPVEEFIEVVW